VEIFLRSAQTIGARSESNSTRTARNERDNELRNLFIADQEILVSPDVFRSTIFVRLKSFVALWFHSNRRLVTREFLFSFDKKSSDRSVG
jgi:hypothetical protein